MLRLFLWNKFGSKGPEQTCVVIILLDHMKQSSNVNKKKKFRHILIVLAVNLLLIINVNNIIKHQN